jgi:coenzyme Q-binding protein COQ10
LLQQFLSFSSNRGTTLLFEVSLPRYQETYAEQDMLCRAAAAPRPAALSFVPRRGFLSGVASSETIIHTHRKLIPYARIICLTMFSWVLLLPAHLESGFRHPPAHLFKVVSDVPSYSEFVPYTLESRVVSRTASGFSAELCVGFMGLKERYTSVVTLRPPEQIIVGCASFMFSTICSLLLQATASGCKLFTFLESSWRFAPAAGGAACQTDFQVRFRWSSKLHQAVSGLFWSQVNADILAAFARRCDDVARKEHEALKRQSPPKQSAGTFNSSGGNLSSAAA